VNPSEGLLEYLRKKQVAVTAEELCRHLHVSRQTVWKHILQLRGLGYDISSVPHLGYQLVSGPDRLYPFEVSAGLHTGLIGKVIHYFDTVASTMDTALHLAQNKAVEGTVVIAETQTRGRGRLGRSWVSPKYKGLYFSIILRPDAQVSEVASLPLMAAVSVCEAIRRTGELEARIKWPNDILLDNKKLGGILTEMNAEFDRVIHVIIGIGINVNESAGSDKKALADGAISLGLKTGSTVNRASLLKEILRQFERLYALFSSHNIASILDMWRQLSVTLGGRVRIDMRSGSLEGIAVDIDADGGLLIRRDSGIVEKILAGDVVHCR
jgi:BirA family transcriptional regulator, biotin operon repressor / biotin---[acetyl-CoA-carboxylase] ligase